MDEADDWMIMLPELPVNVVVVIAMLALLISRVCNTLFDENEAFTTEMFEFLRWKSVPLTVLSAITALHMTGWEFSSANAVS